MMLSVIAGKMWDKTIDCIPFFLLAKDSGKVELNLSRIIEAVIIAAITGMIVGWSVRGDMSNMKADIVEVKAQVSKIYSDIYRPSVGSKP